MIEYAHTVSRMYAKLAKKEGQLALEVAVDLATAVVEIVGNIAAEQAVKKLDFGLRKVVGKHWASLYQNEMKVYEKVALAGDLFDLADYAMNYVDIGDDESDIEDAYFKAFYCWSHEQCLPHFLEEKDSSGITHRGIEGQIMDLEDQFEVFFHYLPDPLPRGFPLELQLNAIRQLREEINNSRTRRVSGALDDLLIYDVSHSKGQIDNWGINLSLGNLSTLENDFDQFLLPELSNQTNIGMLISSGCLATGIGVIALGVLGGAVTGGVSTAIAITTAVSLLQAGVCVGSSLVHDGIEASAFDFAHSFATQAEQSLAFEVKRLGRLVGEKLANVNHIVVGASADIIVKPSAVRAGITKLPTTGDLQPQSDLIEVTQIYTPDIIVPNLALGGNAIGSVTVKNGSAGTINAAIYAAIYSQSANQAPLLFMPGFSNVASIDPHGQSILQFPYSLPKTTLLGTDSYLLVIYVVTSEMVLGPFNSEVRAASADQLSDLGASNERLIDAGTISEGTTSESTLDINSTAAVAKLILSFNAGDLDLHIYDSQNNHVGVNYSTGQIENQIPGVQYSGPNSNPESIIIAPKTDRHLRVQVVATYTNGPGNFALLIEEYPTRPAILEQFPPQISIESKAKEVIRQNVVLSEVGGQASIINLRVAATDLIHIAQNVRIPSTNIALNLSSPTIVPASNIGLIADITIPEQASFGEYRGKIHIEGNDSSSGSSISADIPISVSVTAKDLLFFDNMESGTTRWTFDSHWHLANNSTCVSPGFNSPSHAWYYGVDEICKVQVGGGSLTTPQIQLPPRIKKVYLNFSYLLNLGNQRIQAQVLVSYNGGGRGQKIKGWKPNAQSQWTSSGDIQINLPKNVSTLRITYVFLTTPRKGSKNIPPLGWLIDDVAVCQSTPCTASGASSGMSQSNSFEKLDVESLGYDPNPMTNTIGEFRVLGSGIRSIDVEVVNLAGVRVFDSDETLGNSLRWTGIDNRNRLLANGVYLYIIRIRGVDGSIIQSDVRKLVLKR